MCAYRFTLFRSCLSNANDKFVQITYRNTTKRIIPLLLCRDQIFIYIVNCILLKKKEKKICAMHYLW